MLVSSFINVFQALETNSVLGGLSMLEIVQQVLDDVFADDSHVRLYSPSPYITTTDAQLSYGFEEILDSSPFVDASGNTLIRRIRGIWKPSLSPTDSETYDYGTRYTPHFNQLDIHKRVYDGDVNVDNERLQVTFDSDPGDTTDTWKADLYLAAPVVEETDEIPLLKGWEKKLLLPGCRAWFEDLDEGGPGKQAALFNLMKEKYRDALQRETRVDTNTEDLGLKVKSIHVKPQ